MTEFHKGDKIRVVYEGEYRHDEDRLPVVALPDGSFVGILDNAEVEVLERADDPSKDPTGLVREFKAGVPAVCYGRDYWVYFGSGSGAGYGIAKDREVIGCRVIGSVPGTPAAEAQEPFSVTTKPEPRVFQSDGPEPPADVEALEWLDISESDRYQFLRRVGSGWLWSQTADKLKPERGGASPNDWHGAVSSSDGRYREVLS